MPLYRIPATGMLVTQAHAASPGSPAFVGARRAAPLSSLAFDVLVGETLLKPGMDGTKIADDMLSADRPPSAARLTSHPLFKLADAELEARMKRLMEMASTGKMQDIALAMFERFRQGRGGTFRSPALNATARSAVDWAPYHERFMWMVGRELLHVHNDLSRFRPLEMPRLRFHDAASWVNGLGITVHQVWAMKAVVKNVAFHPGAWTGKLVYTLYDHFGLDWPDIQKFEDYPIAGDGFVAWFILQHYRNAKPFITELTIVEDAWGTGPVPSAAP